MFKNKMSQQKEHKDQYRLVNNQQIKNQTELFHLKINEVIQTELITLQAIFPDSFQQLDENTIQFVFPSNHYNQNFTIQIVFSENYPKEQLKSIQIISGQISKLELNLINEMLVREQKSLLNEDEGIIFQLVNKIDDDEVVNKDDIEDDFAEDEQQNNQKQNSTQKKINHGQLAGIPLTVENFTAMQAQFIKENKINMAEDKDFTKIDFSAPQPQICTGYELFKRKEFKNEN